MLLRETPFWLLVSALTASRTRQPLAFDGADASVLLVLIYANGIVRSSAFVMRYTVWPI